MEKHNKRVMPLSTWPPVTKATLTKVDTNFMLSCQFFIIPLANPLTTEITTTYQKWHVMCCRGPAALLECAQEYDFSFGLFSSSSFFVFLLRSTFLPVVPVFFFKRQKDKVNQTKYGKETQKRNSVCWVTREIMCRHNKEWLLTEWELLLTL